MPQDLQDEVCAVALSDTVIEIMYPQYAPLHTSKKHSFRVSKTVTHFTFPNHAEPILRDTLSKFRQEIWRIKCVSGERLKLRLELTDTLAMANIILFAREAARLHNLNFRFPRATPICSIQPAYAA